MDLFALHAEGAGDLAKAVVAHPENAPPFSSHERTGWQAGEEKMSITPGVVKKRKFSEAVSGESKKRAKQDAPSTVEGDGENTKSRSGAPAASDGYEAPSLGTYANPRPEYPETARQRGQEGKTVLLVNVDMLGNPVEVRIYKSSGHLLLDRAAETTVRRWKFVPARRDGAPIFGQAILPVEFYLR